jgi:hypothetical protein
MTTITDERLKEIGDAMRDKYFMQKVQRMVDVFNDWSTGGETMTAEKLLEVAPGIRKYVKHWSDVPNVYFSVFNINDYTPQKIVWVTQALVKCNCN